MPDATVVRPGGVLGGVGGRDRGDVDPQRPGGRVEPVEHDLAHGGGPEEGGDHDLGPGHGLLGVARGARAGGDEFRVRSGRAVPDVDVVSGGDEVAGEDAPHAAETEEGDPAGLIGGRLRGHGRMLRAGLPRGTPRFAAVRGRATEAGGDQGRSTDVGHRATSLG